jgi:hypothetical protein
MALAKPPTSHSRRKSGTPSNARTGLSRSSAGEFIGEKVTRRGRATPVARLLSLPNFVEEANKNTVEASDKKLD